MDKVDIFNKIIENWNKKRSLFMLITLECILYFTGGSYFFDKEFNKTSVINFIVLGIVIFVTILIWYVTSNRLPIRFNKKIKFALLINIDDEKYNQKIKMIIEECILNIHSQTNTTQIILLPFNYLKDDDHIKKFLKKRGFLIDTLLWLKLTSGNFQSENVTFEKFTLDKIHFFSKSKFNESKRMYITDVRLLPDIRLTNFHKDWDYVEANSKADKEKYKINLSDLILQYISIHLIYEDEYHKALKILTKIQENKSEAKLNKKKNLFKEGRFNTMIIELLFLLSRKNYFDTKNYEECHNLLKSTFELFGNEHDLAYERFSNLAVTSYRIGDIPLSKSYTEKIKTVRPNASTINLNKAFYSILESNPISVSENYRKLVIKSSSIKGVNVIELVDFFCTEKLLYKNKPNYILFEFAEGFLSIHYGDRKLGISILEDFIEEYPKSELFKTELYDLAISSLREKNKNKEYKKIKKAS